MAEGMKRFLCMSALHLGLMVAGTVAVVAATSLPSGLYWLAMLLCAPWALLNSWLVSRAIPRSPMQAPSDG